MRFMPADPDIATIYNRIQQKEIDLQPDFQRGEVWPSAKQQRLIDSILRGWIVPPILVIDDLKGGLLQVLDGQQRLAAIRDFKENLLTVDGNSEPLDEHITRLHGLRYLDLPAEVRRLFDRTTIRLFHVTDYLPEEPAEIFFRLNQPTALTSAEKRNAFFGPVRSQVRELVTELESYGSVQRLFGFSNSRMAYDDLLARFVCILENESLHKKVTAAAIDLLYRRKEPISERLEFRLKATIKLMIEVISCASELLGDTKPNLKLNKATALTWLVFFSRDNGNSDIDLLSRYFLHFELLRQGAIQNDIGSSFERSISDALLVVYNDRATARVADVSSVLIRDIVIWHSWLEFSLENTQITSVQDISRTVSLYDVLENVSSNQIDEEILNFVELTGWGSEI